MKKGLIFLLSIVSFLGINTVSAKEIYLDYQSNINDIEPFISDIGHETLNTYIHNLISYYNENYSKSYPFYIISISKFDENIFRIDLTCFEELDYNNSFSQMIESHYIPHSLNSIQIYYSYDFSNKSFSELNNFNGSLYSYDIFYLYQDINSYLPYNYYYSNFDFYYYGSLFNDDNDQLTYLNPDDILYFPHFDDSDKYSVVHANTDYLFEPYYLYDDNTSLKEETYVTINLNDYPYIALSLKDYTKRDTFYTNIYVKGQLCLTPVYNYGMTEKTEYYSSYQVQRCSTYYDSFTLNRTYILKQDIENNAIYYIKAYDVSKENIIKVDTSIFDISFITEENKDNPYVSISGKNYPTISYDTLSSSATKSEDEDYISGVSCQVGDFNCYNEYNPSNIFNDLFDKPLEVLKDLWSAIVSIFELIGLFIALLPPTMQGFLYTSFGVMILLGVIKMLL